MENTLSRAYHVRKDIFRKIFLSMKRRQQRNARILQEQTKDTTPHPRCKRKDLMSDEQFNPGNLKREDLRVKHASITFIQYEGAFYRSIDGLRRSRPLGRGKIKRFLARHLASSLVSADTGAPVWIKSPRRAELPLLEFE